MPYTLPNYPIIFQAKANFNFALGANPVGPFILIATPCQLMYSHKVKVPTGGTLDVMYLLFASTVALKGADSYVVKNGDAVEVPSGSGRWYSTISVDYIARGFTNEHKCAIIVHPFVKYPAAPLWP